MKGNLSVDTPSVERHSNSSLALTHFEGTQLSCAQLFCQSLHHGRSCQTEEERQVWGGLRGRNALIGLMPERCPDIVLVRRALQSADDMVKATAEVGASDDHLGMQQL